MCFKRNMWFIRLVYCLYLYRLLFRINAADSEPGRQLPTTAARENDCNATQVTSVLCRRWRLIEIVFFAIKVTFAGYQFLTDFYSHN